MKRTLPWIVGVGGIGVVLVLILRGQGQEATTAIAESAKKQAAPPQAAVPEPQAGSEKIVYTFEDDAKVQEFARLWQQRQGIVMRMSMLQAYWNQEQATLVTLNEQLAAEYKVDAAKSYALDTQRRVITERAAAPTQEPTVTQGP
jgi:hypothetical protein